MGIKITLDDYSWGVMETQLLILSDLVLSKKISGPNDDQDEP
jgi:hypothetical protein